MLRARLRLLPAAAAGRLLLGEFLSAGGGPQRRWCSSGRESIAHEDDGPLSHTYFSRRHIGPRPGDRKGMLATVGCESLADLCEKTIPADIRTAFTMDLPEPVHEHKMLAELRAIAGENELYKNYIGMGFHDCIVPSVVVRQMLENAGWITQYTPYQAEIAQGRLESLMNFQTMVADLTGLEIANASLLDEATACAEAMTLAYRVKRRTKFLVDANMHPQNIAVVRTRAEPLNFEVVVMKPEDMRPDKKTGAVILQYPDTFGTLRDFTELIDRTKDNGALVVMNVDLLAMTMCRSPGDVGADVAVGSAQRFGVPLGFGGPHAAFMSVRDDKRHSLARHLPGRLVGLSKDSHGRPAYRLALQTREQHIRRAKATSNICTAQALLANMAAMYGVYHGPHGLRAIAENVHKATSLLAKYLVASGCEILNKGEYFDTVHFRPVDTRRVELRARQARVNLRYFDDGSVGISLDETTEAPELHTLLHVCCEAGVDKTHIDATKRQLSAEINATETPLTAKSSVHSRASAYMGHPVFNSYHSEPAIVRYMKKLENKDLSLVHSMIPLGSCTMKLNSSTELIPLSWKHFNSIHPFAPEEQTFGYRLLLSQLEMWLCEVTGYDHISFQPNSGAQGEYAGLLAIRNYLEAKGEGHRNVCLIPDSAHGTNPASAQMAGMRIVEVKSDKGGAIDLQHLDKQIAAHADRIAAIMVTYPSTFGVFDEHITAVCDRVHAAGGQVYLDGANLNAQVGLCRPADYGSDVSHLNLHKTFCIPHGGGGPGAGPIGVKSHLAPYLPGHPIVTPNGSTVTGPVSGAPWGSASILVISWAYIRMMGSRGLVKASEFALLNANYLMKKLAADYKIEYTNAKGLVAHEFIIDCKQFKKSAGVTVVDIAKRLMDYGFHAPTVSWPVAECLMVEPTESEDRRMLDRFAEAMLCIREEIGAIERGDVDRVDNVLKNAPHPIHAVVATDWPHSYSREAAAAPVPTAWTDKLWPAVGRIDDTAGDTNLVCTCPPLDAYL